MLRRAYVRIFITIEQFNKTPLFDYSISFNTRETLSLPNGDTKRNTTITPNNQRWRHFRDTSEHGV